MSTPEDPRLFFSTFWVLSDLRGPSSGMLELHLCFSLVQLQEWSTDVFSHLVQNKAFAIVTIVLIHLSHLPESLLPSIAVCLV